MRLGGGARAGAIIEWYSHNVIRIEIGDENMRVIFGSRNTTKIKRVLSTPFRAALNCGIITLPKYLALEIKIHPSISIN